jgi:hypothetical protein
MREVLGMWGGSRSSSGPTPANYKVYLAGGRPVPLACRSGHQAPWGEVGVKAPPRLVVGHLLLLSSTAGLDLHRRLTILIDNTFMLILFMVSLEWPNELLGYWTEPRSWRFAARGRKVPSPSLCLARFHKRAILFMAVHESDIYQHIVETRLSIPSPSTTPFTSNLPL